MAIFQVNYIFFYIVAALIYMSIFLLVPISIWIKRKQMNGSKIMLLGIFVVVISAVLFTEESFKYMFTLLNFLALLFGVFVVIFGFHIEK